MYAVVKTGGKQYKVAIGDKLRVEKLVAEEGASVDLGEVLMVADGDNIQVGEPVLDTTVTATVVGHGRDKKIKVFKMKRRKNYRRTQGHRQSFTEVEITGIGGAKAAAKPAAEKKAEKKPVEEKKVEAKPVEKAPAKDHDHGPDGVGDNLTTINGIGPVIEKKLHGLGITTFQQIAELDQARMDEINEQLSFKGRIEREQWVEQAKELIKG
ncbi:MAG: 50S ribosomal protein L21 [Acidiferrobacterales bacterium]|nr:50S ribosomal protein L21 [Acidiferrobacterales bacterium]